MFFFFFLTDAELKTQHDDFEASKKPASIAQSNLSCAAKGQINVSLINEQGLNNASPTITVSMINNKKLL